MESCVLHEVQFKEHIEKDIQNQEAIRESLHEIRDVLQVLSHPTVKNGGGRMVTYERKEFDQMLYDSMKFKWRDTLKDIALILSVTATAITLLFTFL